MFRAFDDWFWGPQMDRVSRRFGWRLIVLLFVITVAGALR